MNQPIPNLIWLEDLTAITCFPGVLYSIKKEKTDKGHLPEYSYSGYFKVNGSDFIIPGTEYLTCFDINQCKEICNNHWAAYFTGAFTFNIPKVLPQSQYVDINKI